MLALLLVPMFLGFSMLAQRPVARRLKVRGPVWPLLPFAREVPWSHRLTVRAAGVFFTFMLVLGVLTLQASREQHLSAQVKVAPGLAAAQAGVQTGDVITAIDGTPVNDFSEIKDELLQPTPTRTLTLRRGEQQLELTVTLREGLLGVESAGAGQAPRRSPLGLALRRHFLAPIVSNRAFFVSLSLTLTISWWLMLAVELIALVAGAVLRPGGATASRSRES
ncbi:MAG: PDZ domain-containing protein [Archangium sp.]|nr:PDZ domain-containing protein [Archangium sp.]